MTKAEQLVAASSWNNPTRPKTRFLRTCSIPLVHKGYVIDESMELEPSIGKSRPARLVKKWVVVKDGKTEFRADTEYEAMQYQDKWIQQENELESS